MRNSEIELMRLLPEFVDHTPGMHLLCMAAIAAHQKDSGMRPLRVRTCQVGIIGCQAVYQALFQQKIQRTINRRRRRRTPCNAQLLQQLVCPYRLPGFTDKFQHLLSEPGKTQISPVTQRLRLVEKGRNLLR
jgi:hypothetical protein